MLDLVGHPNCWFSHAMAKLHGIILEIAFVTIMPTYYLGFIIKLPVFDNR